MKEKKYCSQCSHPLSKKYIDDRERLYCTSCHTTTYENPVPATAAVVLDKEGRILLVKRNAEPKAGQWCLPGGFVEIDESPEAGCLRELKEETGLEGDILKLEGNVLGSNPFYKSVIVMGYSIKNIRGQLKAGDDCDEVQYYHLADMPPVAFRSHRLILGYALRRTIRKDRLNDFGAYVITSGDHIQIARQACLGGAGILQYRDKTSSRKQMIETAHEIRRITRETGTLFIVNDFIDIALLVEADGVHLGQDDISIEEARKLTPPGFLIGRSTHSLAQAVEAEQQGADYIGSGPVYETPTKADYIPIGVETLEKVLATVKLPVVAIGGLNPENIGSLIQKGARNFAMVRAYQTDTASVVRKINAEIFNK